MKSLLLNQWKSTYAENESVLINIFTGNLTLISNDSIVFFRPREEITGAHCSLSQALRLYMYPYFRPVEVDPTTVAGGGKDAKGKTPAAGANKKARSPSPKSKQRQPSGVTDASGKKKGTTTGTATETQSHPAGSIAETVPERLRPTLQLQQINPILFGLPNLTFTP